MEEQSEANLFPVSQGKDHLSFLPVKNPVFQQILCGHYLIKHFFVFCKFLNKFQY